jgi:superfamily II DNA or RNA helicase
MADWVHRGTGGILLESFLKRSMSQATAYRRAAGFFSSSVFQAAEQEFIDFFSRGGMMELICSPLFNARDIRPLWDGLYGEKPQTARAVDAAKKVPRDRRGEWILSWAIANRRLDVRIALILNARQAIYHEKIGLFDQLSGELIAFEGSANESSTTYVANFERIVVHSHDTARAKMVRGNYERLWSNETQGLEVISLHEAFRRKLIQARSDLMVEGPEGDKTAAALPEVPPETLHLPPRLTTRDYQQTAIEGWFKNGGIGIYAMATGTGKTITALATLEALFRRVGPPLVIIIVAPYLNLVKQWVGVARGFGLDPINCSGSRAAWTASADAALFMVNRGARPILSFVTTNSTFAETAFQDLLSRIQVRTVLVADEVHNLGARALQQALPERVRLRLGLTATPERWMDEEGTKAIQNYFGNVVLGLTLEDALKLRPPVLTPYTYHPILVPLDDGEREEYLRITRQLARMMVDPSAENLSDVALGLLLKRARLVACARNKLTLFETAIGPYRETSYNLVYCGDGRVEVESVSARAAAGVPESDVVRQVEAVAKLLGHGLGMNVAIYTAETSEEDRELILKDFSDGRKNALVAIRCLDEGIDIPQVRRAFILASSTNPRQFIQRRGRVLRRAECKESAEIFDFVVIPPLDALSPGTTEYSVLRRLVEREMARVVEFARLAENGPQAQAKLFPILSKLRLMHL